MINQIRKRIGGTSPELAFLVRQNTLNIQSWSNLFIPQPVAVLIAHTRKMLHNCAGMSKKRGKQIAKGRPRKVGALRTDDGQRAFDRAFSAWIAVCIEENAKPDDEILLPEGENLWTCFLPEFRKAQTSAFFGLGRLQAETPVFRALGGQEPLIDGTLALLRAGVIALNDSMVSEAMAAARSSGRRNFELEIGNAIRDRARRGPKLFSIDGGL